MLNYIQMDSDKSAHHPSFPVKVIAAAVSFSPYCRAILGEAKHLSDVLGASLILIHVGEKTEEKEKQMNEMLTHFNFDYDSSRIIWMEGDEVNIILELCTLNKVDLLVLGARVKENILKFYIGSVARKISRKAKCSVMLITSPLTTPRAYSKIVINGTDDPKTENTINTALYLAEQLKTKEVYIANELGINISLMVDAGGKTEQQKTELKSIQAYIRSLINKYKNTDLVIISKTLKGKPGYAISKFAKTKKADLLVINSPDIQLNVVHRIFTHDIEYILANLPCNLLIVQPKK